MRCSWAVAAILPFVASAVRPVVIVPGDGGNQLEAKLDKPSHLHFYCARKSDWFRLWLNTADLIGATDCWADNIKLIYDEDTDELTNNVGVETRVPGFGGTSGFEELDPGVPFHATAAFRSMVLQLVGAGHVRNETLRGAPYDFRYAPSSGEGSAFIARLKALIEETSEAQGGQRVSLVSHSMGCLQVLYLLNQQSQEWKDRYVEKWIPMAGPFGGSAKEMRLHASGDNQGLPIASRTIREEQRSYETNFWLAPVPHWFGDRTLVETPTRTYSAQDYDVFFEDVGFPTGKKLMQRVSGLTGAAAAPGVDVVCMYSLGVDTPISFKYGSSFDADPEITNGDGDGTVNDFSLKLCERWMDAGAQTRSARVLRFNGIQHSDMLTDGAVLAELQKELGLSASAVSV